MKCLITGHRLFKLQTYDIEWIKEEISHNLWDNEFGISYGLSGMASGVDLWFCQACSDLGIQYSACIPFDEQQDLVEEDEKELRLGLIEKANKILKVRNSVMVDKCDMGMVVWDGNKGGTHNVVQQLIENKKPFIWLNPVSRRVNMCY